jgi:hypothetical protein
MIPSFFPSLRAYFSVGVFVGLPGFLFSSDIVNFDYLFFFNATILPAKRRTYKHDEGSAYGTR